MTNLLSKLQKNIQVGFTIVLIGVMLALLMPSASVAKASPADTTLFSASFCQCVVYVKNTFHLTGSAGYARDMGSYLLARNFHKVNRPDLPRPGDIIVMQNTFHGVGIYGHVAILSTIASRDQGKNWVIRVRGANQPGSRWIENNCTNVSFWSDIIYSQTDSRVAYYRHN